MFLHVYIEYYNRNTTVISGYYTTRLNTH